MPLIGRDHEMRRIVETLASSRSLVISGPAGVGKSRLLHDACATMHVAILRVDATQAARTVPLGAFGPLLPSGPAGANLLGWAAESIVQPQAGEPLLLLVDDAHLVDAASAALYTTWLAPPATRSRPQCSPANPRRTQSQRCGPTATPKASL